MSETIENRSELLFLYDITDANPNGDPLNENRPRMDEETEVNIVTDVRLKRTIRDYLSEYLMEEVFIKEEKTGAGTQKSRTRRLGEFLAKNMAEFHGWEKSLDALKGLNDTKIENEIGKINLDQLEKALLKQYSDLRLFGATIAVKKGTITRTGPVQFKFGRSLHKVESMFIKGTTVMPSKEGLTQGTMTEIHILPYSLICFYGIANENAARHTGLTERDMGLLLEGMWNGTKNLITRSKFGQMPRLLLRVEYGRKNYHIGELDKYIKLRTDIDEKEIRSTKDYVLDIGKLVEKLEANRDKILRISFKADDNIVFEAHGKNATGSRLKELFTADLEVTEIDVRA